MPRMIMGKALNEKKGFSKIYILPIGVKRLLFLSVFWICCDSLYT